VAAPGSRARATLNRRLRLLQLVHGYPPAVGGVEFATRDLCERLVADHAVDVTVFTTNALTVRNFIDGSLPTLPIDPEEVQNGVRIRRFQVETRLAPLLKQVQRAAYRLRLPGEDRLRTWYNGPISPAMLRAVRSAEADVICAASFPLNHLTYPFRRPEPRPPVVLVGAVHTTNDWFRRPHLTRLVGRSYATVAHTEHERDWFVANGAPAERLRVIGHAVDVEALQAERGAFRDRHRIPSGDFIVAYIGQQAPHKGIDTLIRTLPRLLERRPETRLVIAGARTPYSNELARLADSLPPPSRTRLLILDDVSTQEKAELLADCDAFASPSGEESFGITTLEAWANAKPVVLGDTPTQRLVAEPGVSALLVTHGDEDSVLEALSRLASDASLRAGLGEAGRRRLDERHSLPRVVSDYFELFSAAARSSRRGNSGT
jgi:glycosyltransferase involved in cell wall biosynthesis